MIHHLPIPTGPYKVGFKSYDLYDPSRKEIHYPDGRLIPIRVYFPMEKGNHEVYEKTFEKSAPITSWGTLKTKVFSKHADPKGINKDFLSPVVMVNPGYDVAITDYSYLVEDL